MSRSTSPRREARTLALLAVLAVVGLVSAAGTQAGLLPAVLAGVLLAGLVVALVAWRAAR